MDYCYFLSYNKKKYKFIENIKIKIPTIYEKYLDEIINQYETDTEENKKIKITKYNQKKQKTKKTKKTKYARKIKNDNLI
jgi:adenylate kinase family enzyme